MIGKKLSITATVLCLYAQIQGMLPAAAAAAADTDQILIAAEETALNVKHAEWLAAYEWLDAYVRAGIDSNNGRCQQIETALWNELRSPIPEIRNAALEASERARKQRDDANAELQQALDKARDCALEVGKALAMATTETALIGQPMVPSELEAHLLAALRSLSSSHPAIRRAAVEELRKPEARREMQTFLKVLCDSNASAADDTTAALVDTEIGKNVLPEQAVQLETQAGSNMVEETLNNREQEQQ